MGRIELRTVPPKIIVEAFLSGSVGGPNSYGGFDGKGPMVVVDLERQEMVPVPGFQDRLKSWRKSGASNPCPVRRKPTLAILNAFINHEDVRYDVHRRRIVRDPNRVV